MNKLIIEEIKSISEEQRLKRINLLKEQGVVIPFSDGVIIGENVQIEADAVILSGSVVLGKSVVKARSVIGPNTWLFDTCVGQNTELENVSAESSSIGSNCKIGPFVHIRPNCQIANDVHLGNFVEVKNSTVDDGTKVSHLTYVGDSDVGKNCNFGCGTVTVNYDGKKKHRTTIGNNCFIGCNTNLIAPVSLGDFAYTAAGSTITDDVEENSLAIARARQVNKENWVLSKKPYKVNPKGKKHE